MHLFEDNEGADLTLRNALSTFHVANLGCKVNRVESDDFAALLMERGVSEASLGDADFVIVKATEGTSYINPYFREWADQVLDSGKQLGLYHFATDAASAKAQADFFYRTVKPYIGRAMLFLDWENTDYSDKVVLTVLLPAAQEERIRKRLTDITGGRIKTDESGRPMLGESEGKYMDLSARCP